MPLRRYLEAGIRADLGPRMAWVGGPRQVGKTTLARQILESEDAVGAYLNWDNRDDRREIRAAHWPAGPALVVLDEIHKWRGWKGWLKGEFDKHRDHLRFLVTGSARLDVYRRGGDSLQGRYRYFRLHPFSVAELHGGKTPPRPIEPGAPLAMPRQAAQEPFEQLLDRGGFPEPLLGSSERQRRLWRKERLDRFFREDVRDLEAVRELSSLQLLAELLTEKVGAPLSLNALREDLEVSHRAVDHWIDILERLYYCVRVRPFLSSRVRSLRKMPKSYLWDWSAVADPGGRFENLVAMHLLKFCHFLEDTEGHAVELFYLRDRTGHEVDFLVTHNRRPWFAVEAKLSETRIDPNLAFFRSRLGLRQCYQVVRNGTRDFVEDGVHCLPAAKFLAALV